MRKQLVLFALLAAFTVHAQQPVLISVNAEKVIAKADRSHLLGVNVAVYNAPADFETAMKGLLADLDLGLVRMPGGSVSDKFYWNGNGVVRKDGTIDQSKYQAPYWKVDYSAYKPGFVVDNLDWSKATPWGMDAKTMHEITRKHPKAHNLVTINLGTGTPEMATEWVRWANKKNHWDVKYWEFGNELNGNWETGHIRPDGSKMTAEKYVDMFVDFAKQMKAVDPSIKAGGPACDVNHHEDYFEPLLRDAGDWVDVVTFHYYSLRDSLAPEKELFDGLNNLEPVMDRLKKLVAKYQPERKDEIEYSITEWNSKLPKDKDAYRLFNGLWFSAWVGEMMRTGVDSATVWDMFSGKDFGHGLLVEQGKEFVPNGRYWAFWLWSHHMADTLVASSVKGTDELHVYATRDAKTLYVMVMNESRTNTYPVSIDLKGFKPGSVGEEVTFSSQQYFWNPYAHKVEWNNKPKGEARQTKDLLDTRIPPYCVKVFEFSTEEKAMATVFKKSPGKLQLNLLLPESGFADLPVEGWVQGFRAGSDRPFQGEIAPIHLSVKGPAKLSTTNLVMAGAVSRFMVAPTGSGTVVVKASCNGEETIAKIQFNAVAFTDQVVWNFESGKLEEKNNSDYGYKMVARSDGKGNALRIDLPGKADKLDGVHLLDILQYPADVKKPQIGGVLFDLLIPEELQSEDPDANLQVVLQSKGNYWMPCGQVNISEAKGGWKTFHFEMPDKKNLTVMDQAFSILFLAASGKPISGPIYLDNIGFMLRPK